MNSFPRTMTGPEHNPDSRESSFSTICSSALTDIRAGPFSAVPSTFIVDTQPELEPDLNEHAVEPLRTPVVNNPIPDIDLALPQWTGLPRTIVQIQSALYPSLAATLLSASIAMLGKQ